jgi:very-short-patch-repair endonuclease
VRAPDAVVVDIARRQGGAISASQLAAAGLSRDAIAHRVERGWLTRRHRGVYLVGPLTSSLTEPFAALLACGPTAVLSHHTAAAVWGIRPPQRGPVDVTVRQDRRRAGVRVHRAEVVGVERDGLRLTTPERTLLDIAPHLSPRDLSRAAEEATIRGLATLASLTSQVDGAGGHRGVAALRAILEEVTDDRRVTRSEAERRLKELVRTAGLPAPVTNAKVAEFEVDALWPQHRLIVEVDGFAFHGTRQAFERDRRRDARLTALGLRVIRTTWRELTREPERLIAALAAALARVAPEAERVVRSHAC